MNRSAAPDIKIIDSISLLPVGKLKLDNGIPLYTINAGGQEITKIDFVFEAGKWYEPKNLLADFVNRMMREGVKKRSAKELADIFELYGSSLESSISFTDAGFQLYSLNKFLPEILPLMMELFTEAIFPDDEFATLLNNRRQKHTERLAKNDYVANRLFLSAVWGHAHPYGRLTEYADFENVDTSELSEFYRKFYNASNCFIVLSGKLDESIISSMNATFGAANWLGPKAPAALTHKVEPNPQLRLHSEKKDAVQTTVVLGNASINRYHPDFDKLSVVNTLFGGYFGSRLMTNIREDKGYTYGIFSSLTSYKHGGIFEISADVGKEVAEATIDEIRQEITKIRSEPVEEEELDTVRNYLCGRLMRSVDGPMKFSDVYKGLLHYGRDSDYLNQYLQVIKTIKPEEVTELAEKYFDFDRMHKITAG